MCWIRPWVSPELVAPGFVPGLSQVPCAGTRGSNAQEQEEE